MILKIQWPLMGECKCLIYDKTRRLVYHQVACEYFDSIELTAGVTLSAYLAEHLKVYVEGYVDNDGVLHLESFTDETFDW